MRRDLPAVLVLLVMAALTAGIYGQSHAFQFVSWDDGVYIDLNDHVSGLAWANFVWAWTSVGHGSVWSPLLWLSF